MPPSDLRRHLPIPVRRDASTSVSAPLFLTRLDYLNTQSLLKERKHRTIKIKEIIQILAEKTTAASIWTIAGPFPMEMHECK